MSRHRSSVLRGFILAIGLFWQFGGSVAFKSEDFKTCDTAAFCKRLRGTKGGDSYYVDPSSVSVRDDRLQATVLNRKDENATFLLTISTFDGPVVRFHMTEKNAVHGDRYEVPDVVLPSLEKKTAPFKLVKKSHTITKLSLGEYTFALKHDPMRLDVSESIWETMMTLNAGNLFAFEHRREKGEEDPAGWWEESFKGHTDSKKRGPEGISFDISWPGQTDVYGLPERATSLSLKATVDQEGNPLSEPYRLYNLDVFEYLAESPFGLYGSIPMVYAHSLKSTMGVFWLNAAEMYVDVAKKKDEAGVKTQWISESGVLDLFIMMGPTPKDVSTQYAMITGGTALPQLFSLGYHQCRWNYKDEEDVSQVDAGFDTHGIPYDVLWLDIEHTNDKRYFTWDEKYFPTPVEMQDDLASRGRKMVTVVDPHIKKDENWDVYKEAKEGGLYVKDAQGNDYEGWCWPGASMYPDWLSEKTRDWWAGRFSLSTYKGSTKNLYTWNDMNEPSVFNGPEITMKKDAQHAGDAEHRDVHNAFGYFYHMATADGQRKRGYSKEVASADGDRPFVLSRAFFAGSQRIGPIWTGDNGADWDHLAVSIPMVVSIGLAGLPFNGADVGGFFGNPDAELLTRWYQLGAYYPFFRGHAHLESQRREPWLFGEDTTRRIRDAIRQRYRLLPYLYTQFAHANVSGTPILRPLWYEFPNEEGISHREHEFMMGPSLLVAPVLHQGADKVTVTLSNAHIWYDMQDGHAMPQTTYDYRAFQVPCTLDDGAKAYLKGGSMLITKERMRRSTAAMEKDPYTIIIGLSVTQEAEGDVYVDDGHSFAFQRGQYAYRKFEFSKYTLTSRAGTLQGAATPDQTFAPDARIERIVILGLGGGVNNWTAKLNGEALDAGASSLHTNPTGAPLAYVIRDPKISLLQDWDITFHRKEI
ncbi:Putative glucan 1,3-alpha-glucosidase [Picochlorum sp. SENEW3]|nr:Putative glucan 1,3-alpha-glucosidase [Picochlorum sp. SENEW3]